MCAIKLVLAAAGFAEGAGDRTVFFDVFDSLFLAFRISPIIGAFAAAFIFLCSIRTEIHDRRVVGEIIAPLTLATFVGTIVGPLLLLLLVLIFVLLTSSL